MANERSDRPGSFAHRTVKVRLPAILDETVARCPALPKKERAACAALRAELVAGSLRGLLESAPDRAAWDAACAPHVGHGWLDLPWYFAESFFYRRILEASGYFQPGSMHAVDPFLAAKLHEETRVVARLKVNELVDAPLPTLLRAALWGNRADLSYAAGRAHGDEGGDDDLLIDDTSAFIESLCQPRRIALMLDNAGTELSFDLVLAGALRARGHQVVLLAKGHPFFVSDATPADVRRTAALLGLEAGDVREHPYFTSSGFFFTEHMPADLVALLRSFDVVIAKGDASYRRLVGDAPWPHATPFADALSLPCPVLALRTCKAEVLVGVDDEKCAAAQARDSDWLVSGRFGLIALSRGPPERATRSPDPSAG